MTTTVAIYCRCGRSSTPGGGYWGNKVIDFIYAQCCAEGARFPGPEPAMVTIRSDELAQLRRAQAVCESLVDSDNGRMCLLTEHQAWHIWKSFQPKP